MEYNDAAVISAFFAVYHRCHWLENAFGCKNHLTRWTIVLF